MKKTSFKQLKTAWAATDMWLNRLNQLVNQHVFDQIWSAQTQKAERFPAW